MMVMGSGADGLMPQDDPLVLREAEPKADVALEQERHPAVRSLLSGERGNDKKSDQKDGKESDKKKDEEMR